MSGVYTLVSDTISNAWKWKEEQSTVEWARNNIYINSDVSPYTGMINFDRTPWVEEILYDWNKPWVEQFNIMASTQTAKTTIMFISMANSLDTDPCMSQLTLPTEDGVSDFVKTKLDPFLNGISSLKNKFKSFKDEEKTRYKGSLKQVPNGMLFILGNTDKNRRSKTVKNIFIDEAALFGKGHIKELIGRPLSIHTKIPTPTGWVTMLELNVGDHVFDEQGKSTKVIKATEIKKGEECFNITFDTKETITCDGDHEWAVNRYKTIKGKTVSVSETLETRALYMIYCIPLHEKYELIRKYHNGNIQDTREYFHTSFYHISQALKNISPKEPKKQKNIRVSITRKHKLDYEQKKLPVPPYTLGAWLGDGTQSNNLIT